MRESSTTTPTLALLFPWKGANQAAPAILAPGIPTRELRKATKLNPLAVFSSIRNTGSFGLYIGLTLVLFSASIGLQLMELERLSGLAKAVSTGIVITLIIALVSSRLLTHRERRFLDRWAPRIMVGNSLVDEALIIAKTHFTGQPAEKLMDPEKRLVHMAACVAGSQSASNESVSQLLHLALEYRETRDPDALAQAEWIHETAHVIEDQTSRPGGHPDLDPPL